MGIYLSKPNTDKSFEEGSAKGLSWGAISMQGNISCRLESENGGLSHCRHQPAGQCACFRRVWWPRRVWSGLICETTLRERTNSKSKLPYRGLWQSLTRHLPQNGWTVEKSRGTNRIDDLYWKQKLGKLGRMYRQRGADFRTRNHLRECWRLPIHFKDWRGRLLRL